MKERKKKERKRGKKEGKNKREKEANKQASQNVDLNHIVKSKRTSKYSSLLQLNKIISTIFLPSFY